MVPWSSREFLWDASGGAALRICQGAEALGSLLSNLVFPRSLLILG